MNRKAKRNKYRKLTAKFNNYMKYVRHNAMTQDMFHVEHKVHTVSCLISAVGLPSSVFRKDEAEKIVSREAVYKLAEAVLESKLYRATMISGDTYRFDIDVVER